VNRVLNCCDMRPQWLPGGGAAPELSADAGLQDQIYSSP
jgi:hypothetical protein